MSKADFYLILITAFAVAGQFMSHEPRHSGTGFDRLIWNMMFALNAAFTVCVIEDINAAFFHFSGYPGKMVALVLVYTIFAEVPRRGMDKLCREHIFKDVPKTIG